MSAEDDETPAEFPAPTDKLAELMDRVRRREYKKRMLTSLPFALTDSMEIAVRVYGALWGGGIVGWGEGLTRHLRDARFAPIRYNLIGETKKGAYVWLNSRDNTEARPVTKYMTEVRCQTGGGPVNEPTLTRSVPPKKRSRRALSCRPRR